MLQVEGVEADDVIGTLATRAAAQGLDTVISTIDKDMAQVVGERVKIVNTMFDTTLDRDGVRRKFGVEPEQIVDYLALVGDTSDNIPGVAGIGPKSASALLARFGSIEGIYDNLERLDQAPVRGAARMAESLATHRDDALLSRALATIRRDLPLEVSPNELAPAPPDYASCVSSIAFEFGTLLRRLPAAEAAPAPLRRPSPRTARRSSKTRRSQLDRAARGSAALRFHTETTSLDYMQAEIVGVSFAISPGEAAYVPVAHIPPRRISSRASACSRAAPAARERIARQDRTSPEVRRARARESRLELRGRASTRCSSPLLDATATRHDLDSIALKYLARDTIHYEHVTGKGAHQIGFEEVPLEQAGPYASEDADVALQLHDALWPRLVATPALERLYTEIEAPLSIVLMRMERTGVLIDAPMLKQQSKG